jgi:heat shock protein 5
VEIIPNDLGNRITPSWVAFTETGERLVGEAAKNQAARNPNGTVYDVKRLIGRQFNDEEVQADLPHFPFKVVNRHGKPMLSIKRQVSESASALPLSVLCHKPYDNPCIYHPTCGTGHGV